ncbi:MAG: hypothetical protein K6A37_08660 [Saccharofermentans sp.]|nr:hypothetical protein [Saccharofermentans sp.]
MAAPHATQAMQETKMIAPTIVQIRQSTKPAVLIPSVLPALLAWAARIRPTIPSIAERIDEYPNH